MNDWTELASECGENYARYCLEMNSKALLFIGGNLINFMVNIESIHDITSKSFPDSPNPCWPINDPNVVPIRVSVNESETQLIVTYCTEQPVFTFVAHVMCGLFRKFASLMFNINANVTQEIYNEQYIFVIKTNKVSNNTLVLDSDPEYFYKKSLSSDPQKLLITVLTFRRAFPFHFICDQNLRFVQIGSGMTLRTISMFIKLYFILFLPLFIYAFITELLLISELFFFILIQ